MNSQAMERKMKAEKHRRPQKGCVVTLNDRVMLTITQSPSPSTWLSSQGVPVEPLRHRAERQKEHVACDKVSVAVVL